MTDTIRQAVRDALPGVRADLDALIRIPSVSSDPAAADKLNTSARLTADLLEGAGAVRVEIISDIDGCPPAVLADFPGPAGAPTVLLYAHHDVQPPGPLEQWTSPPFEPVERGGRLYGRGSADDKAGIAAHLAALRAYGGRPPVNVVVFVEGEEEVGSPNLSVLLDRYRDRLAADVIVLADSENLTLGVPAFTTSLRGVTSCVIELRALHHGVHSGGFGGAAPDALTALCRLLATLHDEAGDVAVDGLVTAPPPDFDYPEKQFRAEAAMVDSGALIGTGSIAERLWSKPSLSVIGIDAPAVAESSNTLVPFARARLSLRLAPGDEPLRAREALTRHLREHAPWGVEVAVIPGADAGPPFSVVTEGPGYDAARRAFAEAYGHPTIEIGNGGSIPFIAAFAEAFPAAAMLVTSAGGDPDSRAHGVDESMDLAEFERACLAEALLLRELATGSEESR